MMMTLVTCFLLPPISSNKLLRTHSILLKLAY
jgi:hypothetical protein